MDFISYWNNQSEQYDIIYEQVIRGKWREGAKRDWCVRRGWCQPQPSILDQFTPLDKNKLSPG